MSYEEDRLQFQYMASKLDPDTTTDDLRGPGKYDGAADRALVWSLETLDGAGFADETAGTVQIGTYCARFGRYVLEINQLGFANVNTFDTEHQAVERLGEEIEEEE